MLHTVAKYENPNNHMIKIAASELGIIKLLNREREEIIEELRDDLPVYDDDFKLIENPETYPENKLFLIFSIEHAVNEKVKIFSDKDEKMFYVEMGEKKFILSVYQFERLYDRKNIWTITSWDMDYIIDTDDQEIEPKSTR